MTRVSFAVLVAFFGGRTLIHTTHFQDDAERTATSKWLLVLRLFFSAVNKDTILEFAS